MKYQKRVFNKPLSTETRSMIEAARVAMDKLKAERGIKAIVPKTKNQKLELKRSNKRYRIDAAYQAKKQSFGAASEVRIIKPEA